MPVSILPAGGSSYSWSSLFGDLVGSASTFELCSQAAIRTAEVIAERQEANCPPCAAGAPFGDGTFLDNVTSLLGHSDQQLLYQLSMAFLAGIIFWVVLDLMVLFKLAWRNLVAEMQSRINLQTYGRSMAPRGQARLSVVGRHSSGE